MMIKEKGIKCHCMCKGFVGIKCTECDRYYTAM